MKTKKPISTRFIPSLFWLLPVLTGLLIVAKPVAAKPYAFPVPCVTKDSNKITFTDLPSAGEIKIFTINGEIVRTHSIAPGEVSWPWDLNNASGNKVATGVYLFIIDSGDQQTKGKLVVIR